ncbi:sugar ABC transporter substrate-binding protein [bacterium]|nr:sugar ABC transporter substrate-binding protein [bacterium]
MKNFICKLVVLLVFVCMLCGCTSHDGRVVVKFASWGSKSEVDIIKPLLADFEKNNPDIKVDFMHIPQNYFQKIHLLYASNSAPDVVFINNLYLPIYANAGVLEPVGEWADLSEIDENVSKALSWKGTLYAVPRDVSNLVIFYNKDLFDKYGVKYPDKNWTTEDFLLAAQKLTKDKTFGISFETNSLFFLPYLMSEGGGILSDDLSKIIIEDKNSQKGLQFYADLRGKYHVAPRAEESASATMAQMFLQQKIGMHLTGRWLVPKYREEATFNWDIAPFPKGNAGSIVPLDASGWAVSKNSKHKSEAQKLVNYLASKESIEKITQCGLIVPARKDVANSKYFLDGQAPNNAKVFLEVINTAKPTPVSVNYKEILDSLNDYFEKLFTAY